MKNLFTLLLLMVFGSMAYAQDTNPTPPAPVAASDLTTKTNNINYSWGIVLGTNGPGIQLAIQFGKKSNMALRTNFTYLPITYNGYSLTQGTYTFKTETKATIGGASLIFDYHPFKNGFKLSFGGSYLINKYNAKGYLGDTLFPADIYITPEQFGNLSTEITIQKIVPYVGIGFGRAVPKKRVNFGLEIGAYYVGTPNISLKTTGMLEPSQSNEAQFKKDAEKYGSILPQLTMHLNFKIGK